MVEIHITPNKEKNYLDNPVSFDPDQTRELVQLIQNAGKIRKQVLKINNLFYKFDLYFAGIPTHNSFAGTLEVTNEYAAITEFSPIVTPGIIVL